MNDKNALREKIEFLRENPIFWSRLGWGFDPPIVENGKVKVYEPYAVNVARHKAFSEKGIKVHSSILPSGWIGVDRYDYKTTDEILESLFQECPDIYYLPRVKLNVPLEWCERYPEDVLVYRNGPRTAEEIRALVGTEKQDMLGFDSPGGEHWINGKWEKRANYNGLIALQSFSSEQWRKDAGEALRRLVEHLENSKWADRIIGYHIAYGCCGETTVWGTWEKDLNRQGDYGINAVKNFLAFAKERGKTYEGIPIPDDRYELKTVDLDTLFYHTEKDKQNELYSRFVSETNADSIEHFCKVVKTIAPTKLTGIFYGYIVEVRNNCDSGHLAYDRIVNSPYIDFVSGPKGYCRVDPCGPGFGQAVCNSFNLKKLWVDEIDNRTHLVNMEDESKAKDMAQTRGVYWREFSKNVSFNQGYWWMDLGGGWLDDDAIKNEIALMNETSKRLYRKPHKNVSEILVVIDDETMNRMRVVDALHATFFQKVGAIIKECGAPISFYRLSDLKEMDLSQYKIAFFLNAFSVKKKEMQTILDKFSKTTHIVWNYTAGILTDDVFDVKNVKELTGFEIAEIAREIEIEGHKNCPFPLIHVVNTEEVEVLQRYNNGYIRVARRKDGSGRTMIMESLPTDMTVESVRPLMEQAGVHFYSPSYCTVNADNRFLYLIAGKKTKSEIVLPERRNVVNLFTGEKFENVRKIPFDLEEGNGVCLEYI